MVLILIFLLLQVPLLPWLPLFSVFVNIYLMMQLDMATWCRFAVWMAVGEHTYYDFTFSLTSSYTMSLISLFQWF